MHEGQGDEERSHPFGRAGHHRPTRAKLAELLTPFITAQSQILQESKNEAYYTAGQQGEKGAKNFHNKFN